MLHRSSLLTEWRTRDYTFEILLNGNEVNIFLIAVYCSGINHAVSEFIHHNSVVL